jgi:hypothetical protein
MAILANPDLEALIADKEALRRILEEQNARSGFVPDPEATPQRARELMLADGIRPEDNEFSREIIQSREAE